MRTKTPSPRDPRRRLFPTLVMLLMTLALISRAVAAPVLHLHEATAAPPPDIAAAAGPAGCVHGMEDASAEPAISPGGSHTHAPEAPSTPHAKACDSSGACCGPLAMNEGAFIAGVSAPALEPALFVLTVGIAPESPHRPPSPLLA